MERLCRRDVALRQYQRCFNGCHSNPVRGDACTIGQSKQSQVYACTDAIVCNNQAPESFSINGASAACLQVSAGQSQV